MHAIRVHQHGGPQELSWEEIPTPEPGRGQVLVKLEAVGVNYVDIYQRSGLYKLDLPFTPGSEGAGMVSAVGPGVTEFKVGDRVGYAAVPGAYAEYAMVPAARLIALPAGVSAAQGAAVLLQGMTAHFLTHTTYPLRSGDTCLVHAGAGGVGLLLCQIARLRGARVLATVSNEQKAKLAREAGAEEAILYTKHDFQEEVRQLTGGRGVQVVYDSVGRATFERSLNSLAPRGLLVLFGQSSGPVPPFDAQILAQKGSLFLTRPVLQHYITSREDLLARAGDLFRWIGDGSLKVRIDSELPLQEAGEAHRRLAGRETTGKVLLVP